MTDSRETTASAAPVFDVDHWSDASSREALDLVVASVTTMVGFEAAAINLLRDDLLHVVALAGSDRLPDARLGVGFPLQAIMAELDQGDDWGWFTFVSQERVEGSGNDPVGWIPVPGHRAPQRRRFDSDREDRSPWLPLDTLAAPLHGVDGDLIGLVAVDLPVDGLRPGEGQRGLLERYAALAERTLRVAVEREELSQRVRLAEATRRVVRLATSRDDEEALLEECRSALLEGFRADYLSLQTYAVDDHPVRGRRTEGADDDLFRVTRQAARECWAHQRVAVLAPEETRRSGLDATSHDRFVELAHGLDIGTALLAPIGAGATCLGHLVLGRHDGERRWSRDERSSALDVARDLGQAVANARARAREQQLVDRLRDLSSYKTQVLSTVSHELKNPLGAVSGNLELLEEDLENGALPESAQQPLGGLRRATERMSGLVDDLLLLAEVESPEPHRPVHEVDLRTIAGGAVELHACQGGRRAVSLVTELPDTPACTLADPVDLDRLLVNLLSNATKYTPDGGRVTVRVEVAEQEVTVTVTDTGIGISDADREGLFTEFFRSADPQAREQPGTGLGLTICARTVARYRGRIEVESEPGVGSCFRVVLPRAR